MTENTELYDHLYAARIVYQDTLENELDIIKELKIYLIESGFSSLNINQILFNFYQHINIPITIHVITNTSINPDPIINDLVQIMFYSNNQNQFINQINNIIQSHNLNQPINEENHNENSDPDDIYDEVIHEVVNNIENSDLDESNDIVENSDPTLDETTDNINSDEITGNINSDETTTEYTYYPNNTGSNNIINVLNSLIININNNNGENQVYQNVVVTVDDDDFDKLESQTLTCDHDSSCAICMSQMVKDEKITLLKCSHNFHYNCITPYLKEYNYKCPVCRAEVGKAKYNI